MNSQQTLPVYLIHWRHPEWVIAAAQSVLTSEGVEPHVIVINNDPLHALDTVPTELGRIIQMDHNTGFSGGANEALKDAAETYPDCNYCVIASHDLHVEPTALRILMEAANRHPEFGVLGPVLTFPHPSSGGIWSRTGGRQLPIPGDQAGLLERDWISGTCMLIRKNCAQATGGFDETFSSYVEDTDFCLRAKDHGWKVGVVTTAVGHGLGSVSPHAASLILANTALLVRKREGLLRCLVAVARIIFHGMGNVRDLLDPRLTAEQREDAKTNLGSAASALIHVARRLFSRSFSRSSHRRTYE